MDTYFLLRLEINYILFDNMDALNFLLENNLKQNLESIIYSFS